jgi:hypothetical protein
MTDAPTTPDPIEIAMEAEASGRPPEGVARRVLAKQERLIETQVALGRWQIASERAGFALKVLTALAGAALAAILGLMAWTASQDRSVVIDPFRAPADLAQQGSDGPALANALQDKLAALQAQTRSDGYASAELRSRAPTDVRVQIPATGVSISDLDQALRIWLGHQTHVTGELARIITGPQAGALTLNIRVAGQPGTRIVQVDGEIDTLITRAAEQVYAGVDPLRYGDWLRQQGRFAETRPLFLRVAYGPWPADVRAEAFQNLASDVGTRDDPVIRRKYLVEAVRLSGGRVGLNDLGVVENGLSHPEAALKNYREQQARGRNDGNDRLRSEEMKSSWRLVTATNIAALTADYTHSFDMVCYRLHIEACSGDAVVQAVLADPAVLSEGEPNYRIASAIRGVAVLHQPSLALRIIAVGRAAVAAKTDVPLPGRLSRDQDWLSSELETRRQAQDWPGLLRTARELEANAAQRGVPTPVTMRPYLALALAHFGDRTGAQAAAAALPADCWRCVWQRGLIADLYGDARTADTLFAEALRLAPSIPFPEPEWARSLLARGDTAGAIRHAAHAHKLAPGWGDPLEVWGEALLARRDAAGAAKKFEAAAKAAPRWGRLRMKWGEALAKQGRVNEARAQWTLAATLDLTPAERAELAAVAQKRSS